VATLEHPSEQEEKQELCFDYPRRNSLHGQILGQGFFWSGVVRGHQDCGSAVYDRNGLGNRQKTIPLSASFPRDQAQKTEFEV
jgi:hypothetical protein